MPNSTASIKTYTSDSKQRKFPRRRHLAQHRRSLLGSEKERRQSSLTQLDFVSTPSNVDDIIPISSDHEDGDFVEPQPKKRQRLSKGGSVSEQKSSKKKKSSMKLPRSREEVGESQKTFTQIPYLDLSRRGKSADRIDDEEDFGFDIFDDSGGDEYTALSKRRKPILPGRDDLQSLVKNPSPQQNGDQGERESTVGLSVLDTPARRYNLRSPPINAGTPTALAADNIAAHDFTTPKKLFQKEEVPSSQTPPSIRMSSRHRERSQSRAGFQRSPLKNKGLQRSPLKEKSANISPRKRENTSPKKWTVGSPESQNPTMKMLERTRLRTRVSNGGKMNAIPITSPVKVPADTVYPAGDSKEVEVEHVPSTVPDVESSEAEDAVIPQGGSPHIDTSAQSPNPTNRKRKADATDGANEEYALPHQPVTRRLRRIATVQDSQYESQGLPAPKLPRKLQRVNTVQDSQYEDLDMSSSTYRTVSHEKEQHHETQTESHETFGDEVEGNTYGTMEPQTYDPAYAALDRDAARFGWTQTQAVASRIADSVAGSPVPDHELRDSDEDEDEDDLDRGVIPASDDEDDIILLSGSGAGTSQELGEAPIAPPPDCQAEEEAGDTNAKSLTEQSAPAPEIVDAAPAGSPSPPSSPPIHPSQISTVVPTQRSLHPLSTHLQAEDLEGEDYSPPTSPPAPAPLEDGGKRQDYIFNDLPQSAATLSHSAITLSSSPLPLPIWTSDNEGRWDVSSPRRRGEAKETQMESLQDFSLPPPPPMLRTSSPFPRAT